MIFMNVVTMLEITMFMMMMMIIVRVHSYFDITTVEIVASIGAM